MSYCRWSSDDFGCDLYCYVSKSGWVTHVAGSRVVGEVPRVSLDMPAAELVAAMKAQHAFLDTAGRKPIDLPHAGETFTDTTLEDFKDRLLHLRSIGYRFPDYALEEIEHELKEHKTHDE